MDPDACLAALLDAFRAGDKQEAWDRMEALSDWITSKDGFLPKDPRDGSMVLSREERVLISTGLFLLIRQMTLQAGFFNKLGEATKIVALGQRVVDGIDEGRTPT